MDQHSVERYYDGQAENYISMYDANNHYDPTMDYPANYFRMNLLINVFLNNGIKRVMEIGVGAGIPLLSLARSGMDVTGFDSSRTMVATAKKIFSDNKMDDDRIFLADIQDPSTYAHSLKNGLFDGVLAMGVMPHVKNDSAVLRNIRAMTRPDGTVFIEFRNKLFSLFTFNRYTKEFIIDDLLKGVSDKMRKTVSAELDRHLDVHLPEARNVQPDGSPDYDAILSKFHNPFEIKELFEKNLFYDICFHWYHYHAGMPRLENENPEMYRRESISLEYNEDSWKGMFLCSAFVVEARVKK